MPFQKSVQDRSTGATALYSEMVLSYYYQIALIFFANLGGEFESSRAEKMSVDDL